MVNALCGVASIGSGLLLICSSALKALAASGRISHFVTTFPYSHWYHHSHYYRFFSHLQAESRDYGEDYSFCRRWRELREGRIHALVSDEVGHIGPLPVLGRYLERLQSDQL